MTCIVDYPTKKAFKEAVETAPGSVFIEDPSIVAPYCGPLTGYMVGKIMETFTNHPKRSWFANVRVVNGRMVVS